MIDFGWTRLAHLLIVLSVLGALVQLGTPTAAHRPLAAEPGTGEEASLADERSPVARSTPQTSSAPRENPAAPASARHLRSITVGDASAASDINRAVFYRPADLGSGPVCGDLGRFPSGHRLVFPLPMKYAHSFEDTWGAPRPQGGHEGTDLMSPTGTPEYAVTDGTVVPVTGSNGNGWNTLGGYTVMLRAAYSVGPVREGDLFYYAHLDRESALPLGARIRAGQIVGYAGDTGQGPQVTRGLFPPHLHFGWYDATGTRSYLPSGAMNPYPLLRWMVAGGGVLGGGSKSRYCEVPRSGVPSPSRGPDHWPAASDPGARPDLDTGTARPAPGPVAANRARTHDPAGPVRAEKPSPANAKGSPVPPASAAQDHRAPEPSTPGKPAIGAKPAIGGKLSPETGHRSAAGQSPGEDPRAPDSPPENGPPQERDLHPGKERGPRETGKGEDTEKDPAGHAERHDPHRPQAGNDEPQVEHPEDETTQPGEETTPDDSASETEDPGSDEDAKTTDPENSGSEASEDTRSEDREPEPPQETTTAE